MTANTPRTHAQTLCILAADDLSVLSFALPESIYGFHAEQCCENLLKALIAAHGQTYPLTHKLERLFDQAIDCGEVFPIVPYGLLQLEPFAVEFRYYPGGTISENDRPLLLQSLRILQSFVAQRVLELTALQA